MRNGYAMFNSNNYRYNARNAAGSPFNGNYQQNNPWGAGFVGGGNPRYDGRRNYRRDDQSYFHRQNNEKTAAGPSKFVQNHNWDEEWTVPQNVSHHYKTMGLVVWVEGATGEVFCERNVSSTMAHFYFDGRTEIDGSTVAIAERSEQGLGIFEGTKVEIEAVYKPPDANETSPVLIHITKMAIYAKETPFEIEPVSMVSYSDEPHIPKYALNKDGDFVLISPVIFSRKWVIDCLKTTVIGAVPEYPEQDHKHTCFRGRTLVGKIITCPRFVGDVMGDRLNVKRMMLALEYAEPVIGGYATIISTVPSQNAILEADELPGELMFFSIVGLPRSLKEQFRKGIRVQYHACKELPGFSYPWKVLEAIVTTKPAPAPEVVQEPKPQESDETPILEPVKDAYSEMIASLVSLYTPPSSPTPPADVKDHLNPVRTSTTPDSGNSSLKSAKSSPSKNGYLIDLEDIFGAPPVLEEEEEVTEKESDLMVLEKNEDELEDYSDDEDEDEEEDDERENCSSPSPYAHLLKTPAYLSLPNSSDLEVVRHRLGCSRDDAYLEVERCLFPHLENTSWLDEYNHVVETSAEQYAKLMQKTEERQKRKEDKRALRAETRQKRVLEPKTQINVTGVARPLFPRDCEPPGEHVNVIGLYDDIEAIFNKLLIDNEKRKKEAENQKKNPAAREIKEGEKKIEEEEVKKEAEEPKKKEKSNGGWWFRRRNPRILPTVVVAELLEGRTEEEICVDYTVDDLRETIVLRNSTFLRARKAVPATKPSPSPPAHPSTSTTTVTAVSRRIEEESLPEEKSLPKTAVVEKENEKPPTPKPPANILANSLLNDEIFGTFFGSLLSKK